MKGIIGIIAFGVLIAIMGGAIMLALTTFRGVSFSENHSTAPAQAEIQRHYFASINPQVDWSRVVLYTDTFDANGTALITLANAVLDDATTNITLTSTVATDNLVPYSYTASTKRLTINGFDTNEAGSRTVTITYYVPRLDGATDVLAKFVPLLMLLGGIGCVIGGGVGAYKEARGY